jgi:hypothetical protein
METTNTVTSLQPILKNTYSTCTKCGKKYEKKKKDK